MPTDFELLKELITPPTQPRCSDGPWEEIENELGISLPTDYKDFIATYGTGSIQRFLRIWNFADLRGNRTPFESISLITSQYELDGNDGLPIEFKKFPNRGGLIPFASTDDGCYLNWHTEGDSDEWSVVAYDADEGKLVPAQGVGMLRCLVLLVQQNDPFDGNFCNIENFDPPVSFTVWQGPK